jgi:hypothetical protein
MATNPKIRIEAISKPADANVTMLSLSCDNHLFPLLTFGPLPHRSRSLVPKDRCP